MISDIREHFASRPALADGMRLLAATLLVTHLTVAGTGCASVRSARAFDVKILAINDLHGQIGAGKTGAAGPNDDVGGAPVLAAYLNRAQAGIEDRTIIVSAGDLVSASPANSALLQDEPTILFVNELANAACLDRLSPNCNVVATVGNHEFDRGVAELKRLIYGGNHADGPLQGPWRGARYPYVAANVIDDATGSPLLPPYVIKNVRGVPIAFIGAVLKGTPGIVGAGGTAGLSFVDEADAVNTYVREIKAKGARAIVVILHQGGRQDPYPGETDPRRPPVSGDVVRIVNRLDGEVDVVVSGHTHTFVNALVKNSAGRDVLVTQAFSAGAAYADISLRIDPNSKEIVAKSAAIIPTFARGTDGAPAITPDAAIARLVAAADAIVAAKVSVVVGHAASAITRRQSAAGESALGDLIADAMRTSGGTDFALVNSGGIRNDLQAGTVTWGDLFAVWPFLGRKQVRMSLTGQQIYDLLAEQWADPASANILQVSGLSYSWTFDGKGRPGIINEVRRKGRPIDRSATYTVTTNSHLAGGGGGFTVFKAGLGPTAGAEIIDVLAIYVGGLSQPFTAVIDGRISRTER